jgi:diguanylate cyclase (GGDEF)-like protein
MHTLSGDKRSRRGRLAVAGLGLAMLGALALIAVGIGLAADRADGEAMRREKDLLRQGLAEVRQTMLHELAVAMAGRGTADPAPHLSDPATVKIEFAETLHRSFGHDAGILVAADGAVVAAIRRGRAVAAEAAPSLDLAGLLALLQSPAMPAPAKAADVPFPAGVADFRLVDGRPAVVAAAVLSRWGDAAPSTSAAIAISLKYLDDGFATALGRRLMLADLVVRPGPVPADADGAIALPLPGDKPHALQWTPSQPGRHLLTTAGPALAGGLLVLAGLGGMLVATTRQASRRLAASERRVDALAHRDMLTGRANRLRFVEELGRVLACPANGNAAVVCLDLCAFKEINDTLGEAVGDDLLRQVAARLAAMVRNRDDLVARLGSDEFAVLITGLDAPEDISGICRRLAATFERPFAAADGQPISVEAVLGAAVAPDDGCEPVELLRHADIALNHAKKQPRGSWVVFEPSYEQELVQRRAIEQDLRAAIAHDQLVVMFQPVVAADGETLLGFEALVRWNHPERGLIGPNDFIPIAEDSGLIVRLDDWVMRRAMEIAADWGDLTIAVNLSPLHFRLPGVAARVRGLIASTGFDPRRLEIEITENVLMSNTADVCDVLASLRADGIRLALDDFGSGYSSLGYVRRFMFDKLKIDKSFVQNVGLADDATAIVECVTRLGRALGITVLAEGVETADQFRFLKACGCHQMQGYLFGMPLTATAAAALALSRLTNDPPANADRLNMTY